MRQGADGGFRPEHRALAPGERYAVLARERPRPLTPVDLAGGAGRGRLRALVARTRWALSGWYYGDRIPYPTTAEQRRKIAETTAGPDGKRPPEDG